MQALWITLSVFAVACASVLVAGMRNQLMMLIFTFMNVPGRLLHSLHDALGAMVLRLTARLRQLLKSLDYRHANDSRNDSSRLEGRSEPVALVTGPLAYLLLFSLVVAGDAYLSYLRFAALFGLPVNSTVDGIDVLGALIWVGTVTVWGIVLFDLHGKLGDRPPFARVTGPLRTWMHRYALANCVLAVLGTGLFFLWGQLGNSHEGLAYLFVSILGVLLAGALIFTGFALSVGPTALLAVFALGWRAVLEGIRRLADASLCLLQKSTEMLVALLDVIARPGRVLWNWIAGFSFMVNVAHLSPVPDEEAVPAIGEPRLGQAATKVGASNRETFVVTTLPENDPIEVRR